MNALISKECYIIRLLQRFTVIKREKNFYEMIFATLILKNENDRYTNIVFIKKKIVLFVASVNINNRTVTCKLKHGELNGVSYHCKAINLQKILLLEYILRLKNSNPSTN